MLCMYVCKTYACTYIITCYIFKIVYYMLWSNTPKYSYIVMYITMYPITTCTYYINLPNLSLVEKNLITFGDA